MFAHDKHPTWLIAEKCQSEMCFQPKMVQNGVAYFLLLLLFPCRDEKVEPLCISYFLDLFSSPKTFTWLFFCCLKSVCLLRPECLSALRHLTGPKRRRSGVGVEHG